MSVTTSDGPQLEAPTFRELGLPEPLLKALDSVGYETPSAIQAATIPALLQGRHVVGLAQTGTGKTAAFALPVLAQLDLDQRTPQALVLAPTRELAIQVAEAFEKYAHHLPGIHVLPVYGGAGYGPQLAALRRGVHIVVGTPGRIMDHLERGSLDLSELRFLVLDEADEMLKMGFAEDVETILADTPADKHVALFSATMPKDIRRIADKYLTDAAEIQVKRKTQTADNIEQRYLIASYPTKLDALTRILEVEEFDGMIVFGRTKQATEELAERLRARGFGAIALNGDVPQPVRERIVQQFKDGDIDILVATDVAARGLDVDRVSHVINFDIPTGVEPYVHRIGRTGRAGRSGQAISFVTPRERHLLRAIEKQTKTTLVQMQLPSVDEVNSTRLARFDDGITQALGSADRIEFFRDVIAHYVREHNVPEVDVAAALAVALQGDEPLLLSPEPEPVRRQRDRQEREFTDRPDQSRTRDQRRDRPARGDGDRVTYRINVGRAHNVKPGAIVGAICNEGGLSRGDFGAIEIKETFSLVELPAQLPESAWSALRHTRIAGRPIDLKRDRKPEGAKRAGPKREYKKR